jgi:hypothetical protein
MICPKCRTNYYSKTHCPKCGLPAFSLNKGKRSPTRIGYRYIYMVTVAAFFIVMFIAMIFFNFAIDEDITKNDDYQKYSLIKIVDKEEPKKESPVKAAPEDIIITEDDFSKLNQQGVMAFNEADYDKAFIYFFQAYSLNKENVTVRKNLYNTLIAKGSGLLSQTDHDEALKSFTKALDYINNDPKAYQGIGVSYFNLKDTENALKNLLKAYGYDQDNDELKMTIAKAYFSIKDYDSFKKYVDLIENKSKYSVEINNYLAAANKEIAETSGKAETTSSHFTVYYDGYKDPVAGSLVSMMLEEAYFSITRELSFTPEEEITAILYTNEQFDNELTKPDWAGGLFDGKIKLPAGGLKNRSRRLKEILLHEYTHAVIFAKVKKNCPIWLNEGLAQILSGKPMPPKATISYFVKMNKIPSISEMHSKFLDMSVEESAIAYAMSMLYTKDLINRYSMTSINSYLDKLGGGKDSGEAFAEIFYTDMTNDYNNFVEKLKSRH